jgi:hypothetical protein
MFLGLREIGHIPTPEKKGERSMDKLCNRHEIAEEEIKRLKTVVKKTPR